MNNIEELIEKKKKSDRKQRVFSILFTLISLVVLLFIFIFTKNTKEVNLELEKTLDTTRNVNEELKSELSVVSEKLKNDRIKCVGILTGNKSSTGRPLYNFTLYISDSTIISSLDRVEYFFDHETYSPKLKVSDDAKSNFSIIVTNSWGCMNIVPVYLYYKNNTADTIYFRMCDKAQIKLPEL